MTQTARTILPGKTITPVDKVRLRERAVSHLAGLGEGQDSPRNGTAALRALYEMALSSATAADALALLHELQVHQVELDLQAEELQCACLELEANLLRQVQLIEHAPVALCIVGPGTTLLELNAIGADLLGATRDALLGQPLLGLLTPRSAPALRTMLAHAGAASPSDPGTLELMPVRGASRIVLARASVEPGGRNHLVALMEAGDHVGPEADSSPR